MAKKTKAQRAEHFLREWREFRKLSQQALADLVGTDKSVISLLELGNRGLSDKWARRLAPHLGTTAGFLLDHDPNDLDTSFLEAALAVPAENRAQVKLILDSFKKAGAA